MRKDLPADLDPSRARLREIVAREARQSEPHIELIKRAEPGGPRVGVFASSFNPVTVAGRAGAGLDDVHALLAAEPAELSERILYLDFPSDLGERSATEVRAACRAGLPVTGLVPPAVESYIAARGLYR